MLMDLQKNQNQHSKSSTLKFRIYLALLMDVLIDSFPKAVNATISTNVLQPGKYFRYLDVVAKNLKPNAKAGESPYEGKLTLTPLIEGISKQSLAWVYANIGKEVVVVWERCSDGQKFLGGSPCSDGLTIKLDSIGAIDGGIDGISLIFEGKECAEPFVFYDTDIVMEDPAIVELAAGTSFAISTKYQYTMTDNAAAKSLLDITGVTVGDVGRTIELVGAGVNHPTLIETSDVFILNAGLSFSAKVGSTISFQITKTATGYAFYEVYRS